jgi:xylose isomerase
MTQIEGLSALELNYPQHFTGTAVDEIARAARSADLTITGLNLRYDDARFARGAFTHPDPAVRAAAIDLTIEAGTMLRELGGSHLVLWMESDGFDYPFQVPYAALWEWEIAGFAAVAEALPDLRVSVEYKPFEPRRYALIRSSGDALLAARQVGRANFGVTVDLCHALMAGEHPPASIALALADQRLFGVHLNDGFGRADDGLMVGSVNPWTALEVVYLLKTHEYDGTLYFDTFPKAIDPVAEARANVETVRRLWNACDERLAAVIDQAHASQQPPALGDLIRSLEDDAR